MTNTTWLAGQKITASALNDLFPSSVQVINLGYSQPSHASNYTALSWASVSSATSASMWSASTPTRLIAPTAGTYLVHGGITWPGGLAAQDARGEFRLNGSGTASTTARMATQRGSVGACQSVCSGVVVFTAAAQYVELYLNQNSGGALSLSATLGMTRMSYATS